VEKVSNEFYTNLKGFDKKVALTQMETYGSGVVTLLIVALRLLRSNIISICPKFMTKPAQ